MKKLVAAVVFCTVMLALTAASYAAPPVEGFIGVPWGADRQQVQKAMEERGFTLLEQRTDGFSDTFNGTFAGQPAQLRFIYEKSFFYKGEAAFLHVRDRDYYTVKAYYNELRGLLAAKYGSPAEISSLGIRPLACSKWEGLPTTAPIPGQVTIMLREGPEMFWPDSRFSHSVVVIYDIGATWARQLAVKDMKDL